ncbi:MAG: creatininase family protein [Chloroflexota bacterium]
MLHIVRYENLTWPEIAALPRDLPLVLPLGEGYTTEVIANALESENFCLLPWLPYGWKGSVLPVNEEMLRRVIAGIFSGPQEEGFTKLFVIHDGAENLESASIRQMKLERIPRTNFTLPSSAKPGRVILIPCGHTEQHGYHLPMNTDTVIIGAIAEGIVKAIPDEAEMLPTLPYGVSMHRQAFAGTFNMGGRVFEDFLVEVIGVLVERGADRFYLMSGHGGNSSFLHNVVKYVGEKYRGIFAATTWLHTSGHLGAPALDQYRHSKIGGMGHAGELETAYMLHLQLELCKMDRVVDETVFISTPNYYMDWIEGGALIANPPWEDDTITGAYGAGSLATAEQGAAWLAVAVEEKIDHVREIHEQQTRRLEKRAQMQSHNVTAESVLQAQPWYSKK